MTWLAHLYVEKKTKLRVILILKIKLISSTSKNVTTKVLGTQRSSINFVITCN